MVPARRRQALAAFALALALLSVALASHTMLFAVGSRPLVLERTLHSEGERVVYVVQVHASPGARVEGSLPWLAETPYAFAITERGEGVAWAEGRAANVYFSQETASSEYRAFRIERPPLPEGMGPTTSFFGDTVTPVDLVYAFDRSVASARVADTDDGWRLFDDWLDQSIASGRDGTLHVTPKGVLWAHKVFDGAELALAAVAAGAAWRLSRRSTERTERGPVATLLRLRDALGLSFAGVLVLGFAGVVAAAAASGGPRSFGLRPEGVAASLAGVWLVASIALLGALAGVARELKEARHAPSDA